MDNHSKPTQAFLDWQSILMKCQAAENQSGRRVNEFVQLIENFYKEQHLPAFFADKMNISCGHLDEICLKSLGVSPSRCIHARLVLEAAKLLEETRLYIHEIASQLNFDDPSYFSRFFKKNLGISPKTYRSNLRRET